MDCDVWEQGVEGLSFMLTLSGIKLPLVWAVRHWCTCCRCCHIEAVVRWCQTAERAWEDGDALVRKSDGWPVHPAAGACGSAVRLGMGCERAVPAVSDGGICCSHGKM